MRAFFLPLLSVLLALLIPACSTRKESERPADTTFTISLSVKGLDSGMFIVFYRMEGNRKSDTIVVKNGSGSFNGRMPMTVRAILQRLQPPGYDMVQFYLENGSINISGTLDSLDHAVVTGTPSNELNKELQAMMGPVKKAEAAFNLEMSKGGKDGSLPQDSIFARFNKIDKIRKGIVFRFIAMHPSSVVALNEVKEMFAYNPDARQFDSAFHLLDSSARNSPTGREVAAQLEIAKRIDIGQPAPLFNMDDQQGRPIELSKQLGKYLLIDFWASWCGPCREDNPNLVQAYKDYGRRGFGIVSVSLDSENDRDKWLEAIRKDKLTWVQVSDLKGWDNAAARLYGINGIPMNFLLDPEGRIIAKGMRGTALRKKLAELIP